LSHDWAGWSGGDTGSRYRRFAEHAAEESPSYELLCRAVAGDRDLLARLDELPVAKRQPNLLLAAVRYLAGPVGEYAAFRDWLLVHWDEVAAIMLVRRTQTNEPNRCATLLPVLAALPQPLALLEVGASAGLCLYPDRYGYAYGRRLIAGEPIFPCAVSGRPPLPAGKPQVAWRAGLDLHPIDVRDDDEVRWLEALVWPEQVDRLARLRAALAVVRPDPPQLVEGDLLRDLPALVAQAPPHATLVVFHSAVLAYLDDTGRAAFADAVSRLPAVWVSNEPPGVVPGSDLPAGNRFVLARDGVPLALAGSHGQSLDWLPAR
jgi:hypothetical protein